MPAAIRLARPRLATSLAAALLSSAISVGWLGSVTGLFERDGTPFGRIVAAERDCAGYAFLSEREACMRAEAAGRQARAADRRLSEWLASSGEWIEADCPLIPRTGDRPPAASPPARR